MKLKVPSKGEGMKEWELCPAGVTAAVLCDVIDLGIVSVPVYGEPGLHQDEHQVKFAFQVAESMSTGKPFLIQTWGMKVSLHEKAKMRKLLVALNGKDFEEGWELDPEAFIGCQCLMEVIHKKSADGTKTYANIGNVMPAMKGQAHLAVRDYVRVKDRPADGAAGPSQSIADPNFDNPAQDADLNSLLPDEPLPF